ncbi:MAG: hypothetical protein HQK66_13610 [Desulfamplus sp.]|nr:hypothetical protein [Desulfamplus sp.]
MPSKLIRKIVKRRGSSMIDWDNELKVLNEAPEEGEVFIITVSKINLHGGSPATPDHESNVSISTVKKGDQVGIKKEKPPYEVPKQYPQSIKSLVERAKIRASEKKKKGYAREQVIEDFFKIQKEIADHIKDQQNEHKV